MKRAFLSIAAAVAVFVILLSLPFNPAKSQTPDLWNIYENVLKSAKYVDLTHAFSPTIAVWPGFGKATLDTDTTPNL